MKTEPAKEHAWLKRYLGEWTYEGQCSMGPEAPPMTFTGAERVRAIGDLWIVGESKGEMPGGGEATMIVTIGYEPEKGRYVGSWIGSMMAKLWVYEGSLDDAQKKLTLECEGPMCDGTGAPTGKTTRFRDIMEFKSDDHRVLRSMVLGEDGKWSEMMSAHYRRKN